MYKPLVVLCLSVSFLMENQERPPVLYPEASIWGFVKDETGMEIPKVVRVLLERSDGWTAETMTDRKGQYAFRCLVDGRYSLRFEMQHFLVHSVEGIAYAAPETLQIDQVMYLRREPLAVTGSERVSVLVLSSNGKPVSAAEIRLDKLPSKKTQTDDCGLWWVYVPPGEYSLTIMKEGYSSTTREIRVEGRHLQLEIRLEEEVDD